jgi:hypothetical protein
MKIKWLIIISIACVVIIFISFLLTKQNAKTNLQPQKETVVPAQAVNYSQPLPPPAPLNLTTKSIPAATPKRAITIINKPVITPEKQAALPIVTPYESSTSNTAVSSDTQPGITKIGKYPTKKETQEMQSRGIVLY